MASDPQAPTDFYQAELEQIEVRLQSYQGWDRGIARVRLATFLIFAALLALYWINDGSAFLKWLAGITFAAFVILIACHESIEMWLRELRQLSTIHRQALARINREWQRLPEPRIEVPESQQGTAYDLDLFGRASIFQLLCSARSELGRSRLRDWLLTPTTPTEISQRQVAVQVLARHHPIRIQFELESLALHDSGKAISRLVAWARGRCWLHERSWLVWLTRALPVGLVCCVLAIVFGLVDREIGGIVAMCILVANCGVSVLFSGSVHDVFNRVATRQATAERYLTLFRLAYRFPAEGELLSHLHKELTETGGGVLRSFGELKRIMFLASISHSAMLFLLVYLPLQIIFLWDFHILYWLERWQQSHREVIARWFDALAEVESLSAMATLSFENPAWSFPEVSDAADRLEAEGLGHPLLSTEERVSNDVQVGPAGTALLVTGSNMSGKSTLLRAIGTNAALALCGAPVCADRLRMPRVALATSMRIHDSLADGVSFYMAELRRLKSVVDDAHQRNEQGDFQLLYLLDEILQGTNSRERHIAVVRVIRHLLDCGAIGAVSTHDLELAESEELRDCCEVVHFRETIHGDQPGSPMTFDYQLRPGVACTSNALKLLELVGLGDELNDKSRS